MILRLIRVNDDLYFTTQSPCLVLAIFYLTMQSASAQYIPKDNVVAREFDLFERVSNHSIWIQTECTDCCTHFLLNMQAIT